MRPNLEPLGSPFSFKTNERSEVSKRLQDVFETWDLLTGSENQLTGNDCMSELLTQIFNAHAYAGHNAHPKYAYLAPMVQASCSYDLCASSVMEHWI